MQHQFSTAICPSEEVVEQVRLLKEELSEQTGWFGSRNADAHITLNLFLADENELINWEQFLSMFCSNQTPFEVMLVKTDFFRRSGAFYLSPDDSSKQTLISLMENFHTAIPFDEKAHSNEPHLSIARRLNPKQLKIANQLWEAKSFDIRFTVDNLAIRKFNEVRKQYDIYKRFGFGLKRKNI